VLQRALLRDEALSGPLKEYGPDVILGYAPGYRASAETGLGKWKSQSFETNREHWGADHCIDSQAVPGVFFCSRGTEGIQHPSFRDIPALALGKDLVQDHNSSPPAPPPSSNEDQEILEERLKSLGYL